MNYYIRLWRFQWNAHFNRIDSLWKRLKKKHTHTKISYGRVTKMRRQRYFIYLWYAYKLNLNFSLVTLISFWDRWREKKGHKYVSFILFIAWINQASYSIGWWWIQAMGSDYFIHSFVHSWMGATIWIQRTTHQHNLV